MAQHPKITPPTHSSRQQQSSKELRDEGEGDLPDLVRAGNLPTVDEGDEVANVEGEDQVDANGNAWPAQPPGALPPDAAAAARATHNRQNRLGRPAAASSAEQLLARYQKAEAEFKADYQGTRSMRLERPYLEAKQAMIDAGLMRGDV